MGVRGDTTAEPDERLTFGLSAPSTGVARGRSQATGPIRDDASGSLPPTGAQAPSGTIPPRACTPRPTVPTHPIAASGKLQVCVEATPLNTQPNNSLQSIRFVTLQNAKVTVNCQPISACQTYTPPANSFALDFTVERAKRGEATTVPFTVVDGRGEWQTFVGDGTSVGF